MISIKKSYLKKFFIIIILTFLANCKSVRKNTFNNEFDFNPKEIDVFRHNVNNITKVNELRRKNIDFIAYKSFSIGSIGIINRNLCSNCTIKNTVFLIWNENNKDYIQKIDDCGNFFPLELGNSEITKFANNNFDIIRAEKIKYYHINKNIISMVDHSTFKNFLISKSGIETTNFFDVYNLSTNHDHQNINYEYNNSLKIIHLNHLIENQIKSLDSLDLFKRDLSTCKINSNNESSFRN